MGEMVVELCCSTIEGPEAGGDVLRRLELNACYALESRSLVEKLLGAGWNPREASVRQADGYIDSFCSFSKDGFGSVSEGETELRDVIGSGDFKLPASYSWLGEEGFSAPLTDLFSA